MNVFMEALSFFIEIDAYFSFNERFYRQCKGLSMGNKLSKILAEIFVSENLNKTMATFPKDKISSLFIYVDDVGCIAHRDHINKLHECIMKDCGMKIKLEKEDDNNEITYMNLAVRRFPEEENVLRAYWWQKPQFCQRILDYHSFHPFQMKKNIVIEYVKNAFSVTSSCYWDDTSEKLRMILRNSNYPNGFVREVIKKVRFNIGYECVSSEIGIVDESGFEFCCGNCEKCGLGNDVPSKKRKTNDDIYIAVPYHPLIRKNITSVVNQLRLKDIKIVPKILISNRHNFYSNTKDKRDSSCIINASFTVTCNMCEFKFTARTGCLDVERTFLHLKNNRSSTLFMHISQNPLHLLSIDSSSVKQFKSSKELIDATSISIGMNER